MKFSNRKELLRQSDEVLKEIRSDIRKNKLNEDVAIKQLLSNIVNSIVTNVSRWARTGRQAWLQYKMPYIMGLDLVNNQNLKVNRQVLKVLDTFIKSIIRDVRNSSELKVIKKEVSDADLNVAKWLNMMDIAREHRSSGTKLTTSDAELYRRAPIEYKKAVSNYKKILFEKVANVVEGIITKNTQYKNFDKIIMSVLKSGISGITDDELNQIKDNYIKTISKRAAETVDEYDIEHALTTNQRLKKDRERMRDFSAG